MAVLTKITSRSLADNAVTSSHVQGDVIAAGDLAPNSVGASELADNAVDTNAIATDAVTNVKVADGAIDHADKIATGVVTTAKIADSSSTTTGITPAKIAENAVTSAKIATGAVIADGIGAGAVVTAGLGASAVTSAKIAAEAIIVKPHINLGVLHPAYNGNKYDGTATVASTTGPAGSTIASSRYGTVQSDGKMYYYTQIVGSKPIKDPRIGGVFGSQRHRTSSVQLLEQETAQQAGIGTAAQVYMVDGREWCRGQGIQLSYSADSAEIIYFGNNGYLEITGYFSDANIQIHNISGRDIRWTLDGTDDPSNTDYGSASMTTPLAGRYVTAGGVQNLALGATLGIHTLKLRHMETGAANYLVSFELIVHDKFTDATCDTNHTSGLGSPASTSKITMDSTAKLSAGMSVTGTGIAAGTTVSSIESSTVAVLSAATTATNANQTFTFGGSDMSFPPQNVVSYGKKFAISPQSLHYDPFAFKTDGSTAWTSPLSGSNNHNGTAWPVGTGGSHNIDTATSLGLAAWVNTNYYRPYNGGRVVIWVDSSGNLKTSVNMMPPNARSMANAANLTGGAEKGDDSAGNTSAATPNSNYKPTFTNLVVDHAQAEVAKMINWREFGNGNGGVGGTGYNKPDMSLITTGEVNVAYVMDDGLTSMSGNGKEASMSWYRKDAGSFTYLTFIGTGIVIGQDIGTNVFAQNLPYGSHILKFQSKSTTANSDAFLDGVAILSNHAQMHNQVIDLSIQQPKRPPIPDDAVVLADYMLMADFVAMGASADGTEVSKGIRLQSASRDVYTTAASAHTAMSIHVSSYAPFGLAWKPNQASAMKLPFFGNRVEGNKESNGTSTTAGNVKIDGQNVSHTAVDSSTGYDARDMVVQSGASALGVHTGEILCLSTGTKTRMGVDIPIHTSSHYQSYEAPYMKEFLGGDRNMEQTNLIVTPDGKSWDEVTRDTSYIGNQCVLTYTDTDMGWPTWHIYDEWRGQHVSGATNSYYHNKDWAIAYDRIVCLVPGWYRLYIKCRTYGAGDTQIYHNGSTLSAIWTQNLGSDDLVDITQEAIVYCERLDYVQGRGEFGVYSSAYEYFRIVRAYDRGINSEWGK